MVDQEKSNIYVIANANDPTTTPNVIPCYGPQNKEYISLPSRKRSYEDTDLRFKCNKILKEKSKELSEAGFYKPTNSGSNNDLVECFYCGGGLKGWERGDKPLVEHAIAFPLCTYLRMIMPPSFIQGSARLKRSALQGKPEKNDYTIDVLNLLKSKQEDNKTVNEEEILCSVCCVTQRTVVFIPCSHIVSCVNCATSFFFSVGLFYFLSF